MTFIENLGAFIAKVHSRLRKDAVFTSRYAYWVEDEKLFLVLVDTRREETYGVFVTDATYVLDIKEYSIRCYLGLETPKAKVTIPKTFLAEQPSVPLSSEELSEFKTQTNFLASQVRQPANPVLSLSDRPFCFKLPTAVLKPPPSLSIKIPALPPAFGPDKYLGILPSDVDSFLTAIVRGGNSRHYTHDTVCALTNLYNVCIGLPAPHVVTMDRYISGSSYEDIQSGAFWVGQALDTLMPLMEYFRAAPDILVGLSPIARYYLSVIEAAEGSKTVDLAKCREAKDYRQLKFLLVVSRNPGQPSAACMPLFTEDDILFKWFVDWLRGTSLFDIPDGYREGVVSLLDSPSPSIFRRKLHCLPAAAQKSYFAWQVLRTTPEYIQDMKFF